MHVEGDPLSGLSGLALSGPSGEVWEASLPPDFVLDAVSWARDRLLGQTVGEHIVGHPPVGRDSPLRRWCANASPSEREEW